MSTLFTGIPVRNTFLKKLLRFNSIKKKLIFFMAGLGIVSVLGGVLSSAYFSIKDTRESIQRKMATTTEIVGLMCEGALLFDDAKDAEDTLSALRNEKEIVLACLYRPDNTILAKYSKFKEDEAGSLAPTRCPPSPDSKSVSNYEHAYSFKSVVKDNNGEVAGTITVLAHLTTLEDLVNNQIWMTFIIVLVVSAVALGVSYILQPIITGPVLSLVALTKRISEEKDYSLRASTASNDEIGVLSSSFNHMLATIQEREKELYEINEKAEAASRSKSEFLANMSHEIRTPINGILGFAQLLAVMNLDEKQRSFVEIILSSGNTLLTIINDILDFSKMEAGKLHIESVPFGMQKVVEEVIDIMTARAEEKKLEIALRIAPGTPTYVIGDPSRVRQVLMNYVGNAVKFTEKGHVMINAEARILGNTETIIRFEVIDTGIGISKEVQKRIFEKFIQADASTTKRYGGTGLGLAISQQLAHLMGGEVGVSSEEGRGSTFWFEVPFRLDQGQLQAPSLPAADLTNCRLLIVDDHEVNRRILLELCAGWKVRADAAESGEEALHYLKKAASENDPYQVAVLDYQLPNMDGEDLSNLIKTDSSLANTSLILLTSMGMRGDASKFREIGFEAYLVKPARANVLLDTISTVWSKRKQGEKPKDIITQHSFEEEKDRRARGMGSEKDREVTPIILSEPQKIEISRPVPPVAPPSLQVAQRPNAPVRIPSPSASLEERMPKIVDESQRGAAEERGNGQVFSSADNALIPPARTPASAPQRIPPLSGQERILLVEDQLTNRLVVENMLDNIKLKTIHAENGAEAVNKVRREQFDLILMDVQMPVMNGFDATREIRKIEQAEGRPHTPIVAVTANAMQGDRQKCLEAGMDDYIAKPVQAPELEHAVKKYLSGSGGPTGTKNG